MSIKTLNGKYLIYNEKGQVLRNKIDHRVAYIPSMMVASYIKNMLEEIGGLSQYEF